MRANLIRRSLAPSVLAVAIGSTQALAAEGGSEQSEIVVTASRTGASRLSDTPLAITALSAEDLEQRGVNDIRGLTDYTPNLQIADFAGYAQIFIRGVGSNDPFAGTDPSSTVHLDGVYLGRTLGYFSSFLDVERIEVLRGPQGTLYGRNSVGGTINVITRRPTDERKAQLQAGVGTYGTVHGAAYLSGGIAEGVAASVAVQYRQNDDYFDNVSVGGDIGRDRNFGIRGQLVTSLGTGEAILRGDYTHQKGRLVGYAKLLASTGHPQDDVVLGDFDKVSLNRENRQKQTAGGASLELSFPLSDDIMLKSLSSWRQLNGDLGYDSDASAIDIGHTTVNLRQEQYSKDLSLTGKFDNLTLFAGMFYFHEKVKEPLRFTLYPAGATNFRLPEIRTRSIAFYGQAEYNVSQQISLVAGLRYTRERKKMNGRFLWTASASSDFDTALAAPEIGAPFFYDAFTANASASYDAWTPKFGVNIRPDSNTLIYASATRGFKSGGYDMGSTDEVNAERGFAPELLWSYELGAKTSLLNRKLDIALTGFRYDYNDLQVTLFVPPSYAVTQNAAAARTYGVEFEMLARPAQGLTLSGALAYLDAKYRQYTGAYTAAFGAFDATGKRLNNAPEWSFAVGAKYEFPLFGGLSYLGADYKWQDDLYFSPVNGGVGPVQNYLEQQKAYGLLNARVGWASENGRYSITLAGRNLLDKNYILSSASYTAAISGRPGTPRTVDATFSVNW